MSIFHSYSPNKWRMHCASFFQHNTTVPLGVDKQYSTQPRLSRNLPSLSCSQEQWLLLSFCYSGSKWTLWDDFKSSLSSWHGIIKLCKQNRCNVCLILKISGSCIVNLLMKAKKWRAKVAQVKSADRASITGRFLIIHSCWFITDYRLLVTARK